jgi:hypothetical protein
VARSRRIDVSLFAPPPGAQVQLSFCISMRRLERCQTTNQPKQESNMYFGMQTAIWLGAGAALAMLLGRRKKRRET